LGGGTPPHDPHTKAAAVMSRGQPLLLHVTIVSPLAGQHVGYRSRDPAYGCATTRCLGARLGLRF
jgi:hypothetical protein